MGTFRNAWALIFIGALMVVGCSSTTSITDPGIKETIGKTSTTQSNPHNLFGLYTFICDPAENSIDIIPLREVDMHLNALKFLEPPAFMYLSIDGKPEFDEETLEVDIALEHPFQGLDFFTGFDVCGIIFTFGSYTAFNSPNLVMARGGDTRLLNPDGYTRWWNPVEFPHGDSQFGYIDGLLGTPAGEVHLTSTLNGYKYFADGLGKDDPLTALDTTSRGVFTAGQKNIRHYSIALDDGLEFNYAVDACWAKPGGSPPYDVPDDFPSDANRPEAWNVVVTELENTLYSEGLGASAGGSLRIRMDVWDHFNSDESLVRAYSPAGLPILETSTPVDGGEGYTTFELELPGDGLEKAGPCNLLIAVVSEVVGYGDVLTNKSITAYFEYTFYVNPVCPEDGWVLTWGDGSYDAGFGVTLDDDENIYVTGEFKYKCDFDPSPGVDYRYATPTAGGTYKYTDAFLCKFDSNGLYKWALTWGGMGPESIWGIGYDPAGYIYILGTFVGTVDFDPGPGVFYIFSPDVGIFVTKFDLDGKFIQVVAWDGILKGPGHGPVIDGAGNVYVAGCFEGTVDLCPGPGGEFHQSVGHSDAFLMKMNSDCQHQWTVSWGGLGIDDSRDVAVDTSGNAYVTGCFFGIADFDPGPGIDNHYSNGEFDAYLTKIDTNGDHVWANTWGGPAGWPYYEIGFAVELDPVNSVYVAGNFGGIADFDPGPGLDEHIAVDDEDCFLTKFNTDGTYQWARTWGGNTQSDWGIDIAASDYPLVYVIGTFAGSVDFDPTTGIDIHDTHGEPDFFISQFQDNGDFMWARTWGGEDEELGASIDVTSSGVIFATGYFAETVDFDPSGIIEEHTSKDDQDVFLIKLFADGYW